jgi:sulfate-transporting ATPase
MSATDTPEAPAGRAAPVGREPVQLAALALLVAFPLLPGTGDLLGAASQAAVFTIVAASLVMLTGWVGQISLGHAALVGIGAYATGWASGGLGIGFPLNLPIAVLASAAAAALLGIVALRVRGLYLAVATLIFSWAASEFLFRQTWVLDYGNVPAQTLGREGSLLFLDFGSRRAFFYVAWAVAVAVLYGLTNLRDAKTGRAFFAVRGSEMAAASLGMDVLRYKVLAFALSGALAGIAGNLVMTHARVVSADTFDFNQSLFYLAIAVVGGLASLAGGVTAAFVFAAMNEIFFRVEFLNAFLQLASTGLLLVVFRLYPGGLASMGDAMLRRTWRLGAAFRDAPRRLRELVDGPPDDELEVADDRDTMELESLPEPGRLSRLAATILAPFRRLGHGMLAVRNRALRGLAWSIERWQGVPSTPPTERLAGFLDLDTAPAPAQVDGPATNGSDPNHEPAAPQPDAVAPPLRVVTRRPDRPDPATRDQRAALIEADGVTVRFGGLTAVNDASLTVREGEICGLIGPNGAGKTTLFNSIAGFNQPTEGVVRLYGQDVTTLPVHRRAQLGVARTFQIIQLFRELTVFDNLLAATHLQNPTGFVQHLAVTSQALTAEAAARQRVRRAVEVLRLEDVVDRPVAGLPFGVLRMVEVARALVMGARVIMLDEPASGLDERETDKLSEALRDVRDLGSTLLLIEHDVRMVTAVTDYIYVLERGQIIAEGGPKEIQANPAVVAAYLGGAPETAEVG